MPRSVVCTTTSRPNLYVNTFKDVGLKGLLTRFATASIYSLMCLTDSSVYCRVD